MQTVSSVAEWKALLLSAQLQKELVVVDCYVGWCAGCKSAHYDFGALSDEFESRVHFLK